MASDTLAAPSLAEAAGSSTDLQAGGTGLRDVEFPAGVWGYERHAVDAYVARVRAFVDDTLALRRPEGAVRDALARVGEETSAVLQRATEVAEDITARSRTQAEDRLARAERDATAIVEAAETRARELDAEIEHLGQERARLIADIESIADDLSALAGAASARHEPSEMDGAQETGELDVAAGEAEGPSAEQPVGEVDLGDEEMAGEDLDDDLLLDEEEGQETDHVRHGEVPAAAELQVTRIQPGVWRD